MVQLSIKLRQLINLDYTSLTLNSTSLHKSWVKNWTKQSNPIGCCVLTDVPDPKLLRVWRCM